MRRAKIFTFVHVGNGKESSKQYSGDDRKVSYDLNATEQPECQCQRYSHAGGSGYRDCGGGPLRQAAKNNFLFY